ncbi:glycosyltransferase [Rhodococcus sp. NBC_00294]|uniref:glycosyltransferase n=1 Tax=Rhodococcus sp. NBC_00294 TaxID=2976004 RepID=UPI002E27D42F|nr:nucleotide disphospho-sugar-binding domain-containing protein [Rhodococcus sp. NBC_00294]
MQVTLAFQGSRGDVQPGVVLATELERRGHRVVLAVPPNLVAFAASAGLDARPCGVDTAELLTSPLVTRDMASRNPRRRLAAVTAVTVAGGRAARAALTDLAAGSDVLVGSSVGQESAYDVAEVHSIPYVPLHFCPVRSNGVASVVPVPSALPGFVHRAAWWALDTTLWRASRGAHTTLRAELGLPPMTSSVAGALARSGVTEIQAYDAALFPGLTEEWGPARPLTGFLHPDARTRAAVQRAAPVTDGLDSWLRAGTPPVYIGFGSMTVPGGAALLDELVAAVRRAGRRVLLVGGWDDRLLRENAPGSSEFGHDVLSVSAVDHTAVLPQCEAVVHHGGAGSTAAGLRAGRPTLVCHVGADQPLWGRRVVASRVGASVAARSASSASLDAALARVLHPRTRSAAERLADSLVSPTGAVRRCADLVEAAAQRRTAPLHPTASRTETSR